MDAVGMVILISFVIMVISTIMAHIAKSVWADRRWTQFFAIICIISFLTFMVLLYPRLPD